MEQQATYHSTPTTADRTRDGESADALRARIKDLEATLRVRELTAIALLKSAEAIVGAPRPIAVTQLHDAKADCVMVVFDNGECVVRRLERDGWTWTPEPALPKTPAAMLATMREQVATFDRGEPLLAVL